MRYILLSVLFACLSASSELRAQQAPDNDSILRATIDQASPYYYPALYSRYTSGDTTLTAEDYRHLYYGYVWRPEYKPFETPPARDRLLGVLEKDSLTTNDFRKIIEYGQEIMRSEPFDPSTINFMIYAYGALGDTLDARINYHRLNGVLGAIESSGTGLSEDSPWHVLYFSHTRDLLSSLDIVCGKERVISRSVAYMPLLARQKGVKGYYFDFGRIYWHRPEKQPEKRSSGWEFNGIPLKKRVAPTYRSSEDN